MSFARIATLRVSDNSYDLMLFRYGFGRGTDKKGRPTTRIQGGYIQLVMESTKSTELLELFFNTDPEYPTDHRPRVISGSVEVCDPEDGSVIRRLVFEEAFIVRSGEEMHTDSPLPMMETITISPLRLDVDRTIRLDRRWPQAPYGWQEFVQDEQPRPASFMENLIAKIENDKNEATANLMQKVKGGAHKDLDFDNTVASGKKETIEQRHHMPSQAAGNEGVNGGAITMKTEHHRKTASWDNVDGSKDYRQKQKELVDSGRFAEAFEMDEKDIKDKFGNIYDDEIEQLREWYKINNKL